MNHVNTLISTVNSSFQGLMLDDSHNDFPVLFRYLSKRIYMYIYMYIKNKIKQLHRCGFVEQNSAKGLNTHVCICFRDVYFGLSLPVALLTANTMCYLALSTGITCQPVWL